MTSDFPNAISDPERLLDTLFRQSLKAASPLEEIRTALRDIPFEDFANINVVAVGKAGRVMAQSVCEILKGHDFKGLLIVPHSEAAELAGFEVIGAAHPVPDIKSMKAAQAALDLVSLAGADDLVIFLISGGGSALMSLPADGIDLETKQNVNKQLLKSGASIHEMNTVRKHLSAVKGGRLADAAGPAKMITLAISDIPGDDISMIASGPTIPDDTVPSDAVEILKKYDITIDDSTERCLQDRIEQLKTKQATQDRSDHPAHIVASPQSVLDKVGAYANSLGLKAHILSDRFEGEARDLAAFQASIAQQIKTRGQPFQPPCVLLSSGETTVTVKGQGRGGRNVEFLLSLAIHFDGLKGVYALSADTDGVDGMEPVAGAFITPDTLQRAEDAGLNARQFLDNNDAHSFFEQLGDQLVTGPTGTNVNDFRAILIM